MFEKLVHQRSKKVHMREWMALGKKKQALRQCQDVSQRIDRERTLTKYIALWFRSLHQ